MNEINGSDSTASKAPAPAPDAVPHFRALVFAKNCVNDHGAFKKGDRARGAFPPELVRSYLGAGILIERRRA